MGNKLSVIGLAVLLAAAPALAQGTTSKQEAAGAGAGAAVGAVVGGPLGLIIGAAIGAKTGDVLHRKSAAVTALSASLENSRAQVRDLEHTVGKLHADNDTLGGDLRRMRAAAGPQLLALMRSGIEMDLPFRTDEDVLAGSTGTRLTRMAASLASMPQVSIQLDGYADERGAAAYNQRLSERRVAHVRQLLLESGIAESRIKYAAHGEAQALEANADNYALQRKVSLTLTIDGPPSFAANPG